MRTKREGMKRVNAWLPQDLAEWLYSEAEKNGVPMVAYLIMRLREVQRHDRVMDQRIPELVDMVEFARRGGGREG